MTGPALPGSDGLAETGSPETLSAVPFAMDGRYPLWVREISGSLPANSQYVVSGNIRDLHLMPAGDSFRRMSTLDALWGALAASSFECLLVYDPVDHLRVHVAAGQSAESAARAREMASEVLGGDGDRRELTLTRLGQVASSVVTSSRHRVALVIDYASRLTPDPAHPGDEEHAFLVTMEKLSHVAQPLYVAAGRAVAVYNAVLWLVSSQRDLPAWLTAGNDAIRTVPVPLPDLGERLRLARQLIPSLPGADADADSDGDAAAAVVFAEQAQGMTLRSMVEIGRLAIDRGIDVGGVEDAVRGYRVGMLENPWKKPYLRDRIRSGTAELAARVRGQDRAIRKSIDILIRSATGLTAAHASAHAARPRGILFFAGPTGVGKTELAKAITELVFGDDSAYARFDMSEFSAEHSEARLIGAPPGYVGHDAGGELTNAVRERPFSLVLFDEIEKAHPRILDKFLQVLEDGRLTDGAGNTVHFSETLLVFTSNLGIYVEDETGRRALNVTPDTPRDEMEDRIRQAIRDHFTLRLNRPELLNRIGDNIVVFDFISQPVGVQIADLFMGNVAGRVAKELKVPLTFSETARAKLIELATADLTFGGRGVGSVLETVLVNPLARALFESDAQPGQDACVTDVTQMADGWEVRLA